MLQSTAPKRKQAAYIYLNINTLTPKKPCNTFKKQIPLNLHISEQINIFAKQELSQIQEI